MKWSNLEIQRCPKCSYVLIPRALGSYSDDNPECDFNIGVEKFNELKNKIEAEKLEKERENWER